MKNDSISNAIGLLQDPLWDTDRTMIGNVTIELPEVYFLKLLEEMGIHDYAKDEITVFSIMVKRVKL
jgi:hypothetical protein